MVRVKKGVNALKNRRNVLKQAKGFRFRRSTNEKAAIEALAHACDESLPEVALAIADCPGVEVDARGQVWSDASDAGQRGRPHSRD